MRDPFEKPSAKAKPMHPYEWLWEDLAADPGFVLRSMFGGKAVYLDGKLMLYFAAKAEPWRGLLVCTDRPHHAALVSDFAELRPHPILPKWLYLPESAEDFERMAGRLVTLARRRDPRLGVAPQPRKKKRPAKGRPWSKP
jgi:hypothetical protein